MKDIRYKSETQREASAVSTIVMAPETVSRLLKNDVPKKDVLVVARMAAIMAAKKTSDVIPYCHPLLIDSVEVIFETGQNNVAVMVTVSAIAKTGTEMEALTAASSASLTIYDMLKPIDKHMEIVSTKLVSKSGGKTSYVEKLPQDFRAAVIVTSDSTAKGKREDKSGKIIKEKLASLGIEIDDYIILADEIDLIKQTLVKLCDAHTDLIVTTGGTGLGPRDVTVEATRAVIEREMPAVSQALFAYGQKRTPYAMLSRGLAGMRQGSLIVNLPGSSNGTREGLEAIFPAVLHVFKMLRGANHD